MTAVSFVSADVMRLSIVRLTAANAHAERLGALISANVGQFILSGE